MHANAVARFGIDASYVTSGTNNKIRLVRGKNGDLWGLFFALLEMRRAELGIAKVASHIEDVGALAIEQDFAAICDIIGNALADEAAELTAKLLQPRTPETKRAELWDKETFLICIRIGFVQARLWE